MVFFCYSSDVFVSTFERDAPLQHHIHNLCEAWWKKDLEEKEKFGRTAFFVSLKNIVALKKPVSVRFKLHVIVVAFATLRLFIPFLSQVTEIQRVWRLHNVLLTLDYTAEDNKEMVDLLLQCFQRPMFIKNDDVGCSLFLLFAPLSC